MINIIVFLAVTVVSGIFFVFIYRRRSPKWERPIRISDKQWWQETHGANIAFVIGYVLVFVISVAACRLAAESVRLLAG